MYRMSAQRQLRRLRALSQRQVASNMQAAAVREVNRKKGKWMPRFIYVRNKIIEFNLDALENLLIIK